MSQRSSQPPYYPQSSYPNYSDPSRPHQYPDAPTPRSYTPGPPSSTYSYANSGPGVAPTYYDRPASTQPSSPSWTRHEHSGYPQAPLSSNYAPPASTSSSASTSAMHSSSHQYYSSSSQTPTSSPTYPNFPQDQQQIGFLPTPTQLMQSNSASHGPPAPYRRHSLRDQVAAANTPTSDTTRYPCDVCHKTFSRAYDRKRHYETAHGPPSTSNRCKYCGKDFSRADSLKRHLDNGGCEELARTQTRSASAAPTPHPAQR